MISNYLISRISKQPIYKASERFVHILSRLRCNNYSPMNINFKNASPLKKDVNNTLSNKSMEKAESNISNTMLSMTTKRTFQPHTKRRKNKHGFLSRVQSSSGRKLNARRIAKGRWRVSV